MNDILKPELLAPAGDMEKLIVAIKYGADAVYLGGENLGLRANAKNFNLTEMEKGIKFAHENNKKVYITANIFAHNQDFQGMASYFKSLENIGADALIISDPGVFSLARETVANMEIHISTQANNTNAMSAMFWHKLGAKRVVLARELSIAEISQIKKELPTEFEIESFVHGAMCISYSGRCLLSNYMSDRDSNKGDCSQPCRWKYNLVEEKRPGEYMPVYEDERGTYIYNSKDLCLIEHIPELIFAGINSFKIEGRMKTSYYVGTVVKAYREAIDDFFKDPELYLERKNYYLSEIKKSSHRNFTTGFYFNKPDNNEQIYNTSAYIRNYDFVGMVLEYDNKTKLATIEQRNKMVKGDILEIFRCIGENIPLKITEIFDEIGNEIDSAPHPQQIVKIRVDFPLEKYDILRKKLES